jgi:cation:H+ antiporter
MVISIILLIVGFVILIKGADVFVDGASSLAKNFNISKMVIGLTIVAFGTSAPEFAVSIKAMLSNSGDIVLGNVIGSNILNILLIVGVCALIKPITVKSNTIKKEIPLVMLFSLALIFLMKDNLFGGKIENLVTRNDGFIILLFFGVFIYYLFSIMCNKTDEDIDEEAKYNKTKSFIFTSLGIVGIIVGSNFVVDNATKLATILGVTERIISLTVIAFGTSLPELVTSIVATRKNEQEILVGNIVGSNLFNIGIVLGLPIAMFGTIPSRGFSGIDLIALIISALLLFLFSFRKKKINKMGGLVMLITFVIYYTYVLI